MFILQSVGIMKDKALYLVFSTLERWLLSQAIFLSPFSWLEGQMTTGIQS